MIVPSGKRREQVAQGMSRSGSIFDKLFDNVKISQTTLPETEHDRPNKPKDLKVDELQQTLMDSNSSKVNPEKFAPEQEPDQESEEQANNPFGGGEFIDISKQISQKVIDALGLNKRPNESWQGKTEIANDGNEVVGITIKLTKAQPKDMMAGPVVTKGGPPFPQNQQPGATQGGQGNSSGLSQKGPKL